MATYKVNITQGDSYDIHDNTGCTMHFGKKKEVEEVEEAEYEEVMDDDAPETTDGVVVEEAKSSVVEEAKGSVVEDEKDTMARIQHGLKSVVDGKKAKSDYYYGAIVKFINERKNEFFGCEMSFADMEDILKKSGLFAEGKHPKSGTIQRIAISGKFPNWKMEKNITVWVEIKDMIDTFYKAYKG